MSNIDYIQAQINLLHAQLDAKYAELHNALRPKTALQRRGPILEMKEKRDNKSSSKLSNIESNFQEDMINDMFNDMSNEYD